MTTPRAALLPTASTLHHEADADVLGRPVAGVPLLRRQVELLRATGHDPVVVLGPGAPPAGAVSARSAAAAAERLAGAERVTVLGHGVLMAPDQLDPLLARPAVLVRPEAADWERIDADWSWAGALAMAGEEAREVLTGLGDWDPQATLLRHAVQRGLPRVPVSAARVAHGFAGGADALFAQAATRRVERDDGWTSEPGQQLARLGARRIISLGCAAAVAPALVLAMGALLLGGTDWPVASLFTSAAASLAASLALAHARLRDDPPSALATVALGLVALTPLVVGVRAGGVLGAAIGAGLILSVLGQGRARGLPPALRIDLVLGGLAVLALAIEPLPALAIGTVAVAARPAFARVRRWRRGGLDAN